MTSMILKISSFFKVILIMIIVVFSAVFSILSMIINPSGTLSFRVLRLTAKSILFAGGVKLSYRGIDNIDTNKIQVFAANHVSNFDIPVVYSIIPVPTGWLAKKELFRIPFLGWLMKANKFISIDRGEGRKAVISLAAAVEKVKRGTRIVIFPEGTRSKDGTLLPFKKLLFRLCLKTGVPIVPIYIHGSGEIMKTKSMIIKSGEITVVIGKEIDTSKYYPNKVVDLMDELREKMLDLQKNIS
jgi:1-acyl-sn-glycerol-3-phosphate acyltransferase